MNWFWDKQKKPGDLLDPDKRRISPAGRNAFWGGLFRTYTYNRPDNALLGNFYLKAQRRADSTWDVFRISNRTIGDGAEGQKKEKSGLDFFDALSYLATFETSETDLGKVRTDKDEQKKLGFCHYKAFGEREGYAFDNNGLPHETEDGKIVTNGEFLPDDVKSFERNYAPAQAELKKIFNGTSNAALDGLMASATVTQDNALEAVLNILRRKEALAAIQPFVKGLLSLWTLGLKEGFWGRDSSQPYEYTRYDSSIRQKFKYIDQTLKELKDGVDVSDIARSVEVSRYAYALQYAQQLFHARVTGQDKDHSNESKVLELKKECLKSLEKLGMPPAEAAKHLEAAILEGFEKYPSEIPEAVRNFATFVEKGDDNIIEEARKTMQAATKPASTVAP